MLWFWLFVMAVMGLVLLWDTFKNVLKNNKIKSAGLGGSKYKDTANLIGGNHPLLGSTYRNVILAIRDNSFTIADSDNSEIIVDTPIKNVEAEIVTVSAATAANIFLFGIVGLGARERLLQITIYDESTKETYKSLFKDTSFSPDNINRERYNFLKLANSQTLES
ncbi:MAG: hypothetical protein ACM3MK_06975 [Chitinophagales bacterium]